MSENLNCSTPDFSKYDFMSIGELEEILRADAQGPERDDSDVDEILYVMEVLAKKRRQNGIAGKTALEAYQEFQQHYLPRHEEEEDIESVPNRRGTIIPFRRIAAIAASLVLIFTLTTSANAFGWKDIWNAVARWAEETFSFSTGVEGSTPSPTNDEVYASLHEALAANNRETYFLPTLIPDGYLLDDIYCTESPTQEMYLAIYLCGEKMLKISVKTFQEDCPEQIEVNEGLLEVYTLSGIDYYIIRNNGLTQVAWITGMYECYIAGELVVDDLKLMIDSIGKE